MNISSINTTTGYSTETYGSGRMVRENIAETVDQNGKLLSTDIDRVLESLQGSHTTVKLSIHKDTNQIMYKVTDKDTGELIREIPEEKLLDMVANLMKLNGILIDKKI